MGIMSCLGIILWFAAPIFTSWFTTDSEAARQVIMALRIVAINQPVLACSLILPSALQGAGDTKPPLISTLFGMWGVRVVGVYLLGQQLGWGIAGVWISIGIDLALRSFILLFTFLRKIARLERSPS